MPSVGVDSSPVAVAISQAKLASAGQSQVVSAAKDILDTAKEPSSIPSGEFWRLLYHERTLARICQLRETFLRDCSSPARILLRAIILGALHGPRPKAAPSYFSNQSPRTYAPKPDYAVKFWTSRGMRPDDVDVLSIVKTRADRYLAELPPNSEGRAVLGDSRSADTFSGMPKARFIVTSPPYYGMRTYLPDQWLRLWFLGGPDHVKYGQSEMQLEHLSAVRFAAELSCVWKNVASRAAAGARLIIRYGGINTRVFEPKDILEKSLKDSGWRMVTAREAPDSGRGRRQARQFRPKPKKAIVEYDVYCHRA
jgi:hypothetical protein